jgi:hypothetical protein
MVIANHKILSRFLQDINCVHWWQSN